MEEVQECDAIGYHNFIPIDASTPLKPASSITTTPPSLIQRLGKHFPGGQFFRYLCVGVFNTLFGYCTFAAALYFLNLALPQRFLSLTVVLASIVSTPLNITVAYFGYKFLVFKTHGNYLREWLKCFAVYGTSMIPGLVILSVLTGLLQGLIHRHATALHAALAATESHLHGSPLAILQHVATGKAMAGYIAGAIVIAFTTIYSFIGHKKVTFRQPPPSN
jgi:putative flippase GtrA